MEAEVLGAGASTEAASTSETFRVGPFDDPDRYEIGEPVEAGAEGILYRGRVVTPTSRLSLSVAVKALQTAYASRIEQWAARWRDQVELLRSLQIPGLVGVREGFVGPLPHVEGGEVAGRNLYLVMNWVEGEALDHWVLHHRGIDVRNALKLLLPVAVAVDTMHGGQLTGSVPVVHRDIKPANILIGQNGSVLVDFGLTKGLSIGHPVGRAGTPGYIAPEVVAGGGYTPAADRYAFGATVFFLLTGRHPPAAPKPQELRQLLEASPLGGPSQVATIPAELVDRVVTMLDPDPFRRPAALANWIAQLRQSSLDDEVLTVRLAPPAPTRPAGARRASAAGSATSASAGTGSASRPTEFLGGRPSSGGASVPDGRSRGPRTGSQPSSGSDGHAGVVDAAQAGRRSRRQETPLFPGALGPAGISGGVGVSAQWVGDGRPTVPFGSPATTAGSGASTGLARTAPWTDEGEGEASVTEATSGDSLHDESGVGGADLAGGPAHRRGAAHAAPRRQPQHARPQAPGARRLALACILAIVLTAVASDAGALARPIARRTPVAAGERPSPVPPTRPTVTDPDGNLTGFGLEGIQATGLPAVAPTTSTTSGACFKSYDPICGPLKWTPVVTNQPLSFVVTYSPQNPAPNQQVTFNIDVTDPDDSPIEMVGEYYGDQGSGTGTAAGPADIHTGCNTPYGTWPAPPPGVPGHIEQQMKYVYATAGSYQVHFVAASGQTSTVCGPPDPYASTGQSNVVTVTVSAPPPPPPPPTTTTTVPPTTTTTVAPTTTTTVGTPPT